MRIKQFRFRIIDKYLQKNDHLHILDIGSGSHSPTLTKNWKPGCVYTAVDVDKNYDNSEADIQAMDQFIQMDLTTLNFEKLPDNHFDIIIMSHVIEHLHNGDFVLKGLIPKLKTGGLIYIEFPSARSIKFPSMKETLNFFDDPTHCRIFSLKEICNLMMQNNLSICRANTRRSWISICLIPVKVVYNLATKHYIRAGTFWDLYGFAEYTIGRKNR